MKGVRSNIDILIISETALETSFPTNQFLINAYTSPYILDRNGESGGILVYVPEDIPPKLITANLPNAEGFFLEINLRKKKWVTSCSNNEFRSIVNTKNENLQNSYDTFTIPLRVLL